MRRLVKERITDLIITYGSAFNPGLQVFHALLTWYYTALFQLPILNCPEKDNPPLKYLTNKQKKPLSKSSPFCMGSEGNWG